MSEIIITNLKVVAKHGVFDKEKINSQPFLFDCVLEYDFEKAAEAIPESLPAAVGGEAGDQCRMDREYGCDE